MIKINNNMRAFVVGIVMVGVCLNKYQETHAYVSYERPNYYVDGDRIPLFANKLTSANALEAMDPLTIMPCSSTIYADSEVSSEATSTSDKWSNMLHALHGDSIVPGPAIDLRMKRDVACGQICLMEMNGPVDEINTTTKAQRWVDAIHHDFKFNYIVDGMPVAHKTEDDASETVLYWEGIPVGYKYSYGSTVVNNHFNFEVHYTPIYNRDESAPPRYQILKTIVEPFSIGYTWAEESNGFIRFTEPILQSCVGSQREHTDWTMTQNMWEQPVMVDGSGASQEILFTYDVIWVKSNDETSINENPSERWNVFLKMDGGVDNAVRIFGLVLAVVINLFLVGCIWTWIMRDADYKPILTSTNEYYMHEEDEDGVENKDTGADDEWSDEQKMELQLWPLSHQVFVPPSATSSLSVLCGTGSQLLITASLYVFFFGCGVINQSLGAGALLPGIIFFLFAGFPAGYVTARLYNILYLQQQPDAEFMQSQEQRRRGGSKWYNCYNCRRCTTNLKLAKAVQMSAVTALAFPLFGLIIVHLVYDVLPDSSTAPDYKILSSIPGLLALWLCGLLPLTMLGGYFGYSAGVIHNFPIKAGNTGYQDLALEQDLNDQLDQEAYDIKNAHTYFTWKAQFTRCCCRSKGGRMALMFLAGGILPVMCCFVEYAYSVAGPVYVGYYALSGFFTIAAFFLFIMCTGAVAVLLYYAQMRRQQKYDWWWESFVAAGSSGWYILVLSLTWLFSKEDVGARATAIYFFWFLFCSLGVLIMTGFVGVACCIIFNRCLYGYVMRRADEIDARDTLAENQDDDVKQQKQDDKEKEWQKFDQSFN